MTLVPPPTLYNQSVLNDEDFVANFVARRKALETLRRRLSVTGPEDDAQHQILIGARGMGKTSLLRRLAIEINRIPDLSERFIPLMFREEQYNVLYLRDFWQNCGEALAEWAEAYGMNDLATRLDDEIFSEAWATDEGAADRFHAEMTALGKRAVLLVDNLDLILGALKDSDRWSFRRSLQLRGGPILIGAATQSLRESADRKAAFYEFFQPCHLEPLSLPETESCMRALATGRGEHGKRVVRVLKTDTARLRVLHRLTGGNPRVLALTYRLLETADSNNAMADLERLLDEVTPYYKARIEEYHTPLQRATIDAIALHWDPVTSGDLSRITGVPSTTLSPQLNRLRKDGLIETTETSGSYSGYQIVERFLNIWYLMRHGTRRTKQRMRWLVAFLSSFYTSHDLAEIDREAKASGLADYWTQDYAYAFEQAKRLALPKWEAPVHPAIRGDAETGPPENGHASAVREAEAMVNTGITLVQSGDVAAAIETYDSLVARFGDSDLPQLQQQVAMAMLNKGAALGQRGNAVAAIEAYDNLIARFGDSDQPHLQEAIAIALVNKGIALDQSDDAAAAVEIYDALIVRFIESELPQLQKQIGMAMVNKGAALGQSGNAAAAIEIFDALIARFGESDLSLLQESVAKALVDKGTTLSMSGDAAAAIETYDALIARFGDSDLPQLQEPVAIAMVNKGFILGQSGHSAAAIEACDALIARFSDSGLPQLQEQVAMAIVNKGAALSQSGDAAAAIEIYDTLLARFRDSKLPHLQEQVARAMVNKGVTLGNSGETSEELECYEQSLALLRRIPAETAAPQATWVAIRLANRLSDLGVEPHRAEALLFEAAEHHPLSAYTNLFWLYLSTDRAAEAEATLNKLDGLPAEGRALIDAALALNAENFGQATEHLETTLNEGLSAESIDFTEDLERLIRIAVAKGFGERLIAWFEKTRFADRYAPVHVALKAFVHGEKLLLDSNPEVRHAASLIFNRLAAEKPASTQKP